MKEHDIGIQQVEVLHKYYCQIRECNHRVRHFKFCQNYNKTAQNLALPSIYYLKCNSSLNIHTVNALVRTSYRKASAVTTPGDS